MKKNTKNLRIISGELKGRKIFIPNIIDLRVLKNRVRESIFGFVSAWFGEEIKKINVADPFAGSGIVSFEFISRGAKKVFINDINSKLANNFKKIAEQWKINPVKIEITNLNYKFFLLLLGCKIDLLFLDPPYSLFLEQAKIIERCVDNSIVKENSLIISTLSSKDSGRLIQEINKKVRKKIRLIKNKFYGNTCVIIMQVKNDASIQKKLR